MFDNIGGKLKRLASTVTILGIVSGLITLIGMILADLFWLGLLCGVGIALISWISSFQIYAFGEVVINTSKTAENTALLLEQMSRSKEETAAVENTPEKHDDSNWVCPQCGRTNFAHDAYCVRCLHKR